MKFSKKSLFWLLVIVIFCFFNLGWVKWGQFMYSEEALDDPYLNLEQKGYALIQYDDFLENPIGVVVAKIMGYPKVPIEDRRSQLKSQMDEIAKKVPPETPQFERRKR